MKIRVIPTSVGPVFEVDGESVKMRRSQAHQLAIALLSACVPETTESIIALELHGTGPDPSSDWETFGWR